MTEHPDLPSPSPNHQHLTSAIVRRPCNIVRGISCTSMTEPCSTQKLIPEFTSRSSMLPWRISCSSWRPVPLCAATQDSPVDGDYYYYLLWDSTQPLCSAGRGRIQRESRMLVVTETCGDDVVLDDVFRRRKLSLMKIWSSATMLLLFESCCWFVRPALTSINPAKQGLCKANPFSENRFSFHLVFVFVGRKWCSSFWEHSGGEKSTHQGCKLNSLCVVFQEKEIGLVVYRFFIVLMKNEFTVMWFHLK